MENLIYGGKGRWKGFLAKRPPLVTTEEAAMLESGIDPDEAFRLTSAWMFSNGLTLDEAAARLSEILRRSEGALAKGIDADDVLDYEGAGGKSIKDVISGWADEDADPFSQLARGREPFDWRGVVDVSATTPPTKQAYHLHPAIVERPAQRTPSSKNTGMSLLERPAFHPARPFVSTSTRDFLRATDPIRAAISKSKPLVVEGVGRLVPNPDACGLESNLESARQRLMRLEKEANSPLPAHFGTGLAIRVMADAPDAFTSSSLTSWPAAFLEERSKGWKDAFARRIASWFVRTRDRASKDLAEAGWSRTSDVTEENPAFAGNDVRLNALRRIELEVLLPVAEEAWGAVEGATFWEVSFSREEAREALFEMMDANLSEKRGATLGELDRIRRDAIRLAFSKHPPPSLSEDFGAWRRARGFADVLPPGTEAEEEGNAWWKTWMKRETAWIAEKASARAAAASAPSRLEILAGFERFLESRAIEETRKRAAEATKKLPLFVAFHADELALSDAFGGPRILSSPPGEVVRKGEAGRAPDLSDEAEERAVDYATLGKDPAYPVLVELAAYPGPGRMRELEEGIPGPVLDSIQEGFYDDGILGGAGRASEAVKQFDLFGVLAKFYELPLERAAERFGLLDPSRGPETGDGAVFSKWIRALSRDPEVALGDPKARRRSGDDVRYEIARLRKSLSVLARFSEVDRDETLRKGGSPDRISLRARVGEWPPDATKVRFTWKDVGAVLRSEERTVTPGSGTGRSPLESTFDALKRGGYSCVVVAEDADGIEVAKGTSSVATITVVSRCARCGRDFDVDVQESASFPDGRLGQAERISRACAWTSSLVPRKAPTSKTFETLREVVSLVWDFHGEHMWVPATVPNGRLLFDQIKEVHEQTIGPWMLGAQPRSQTLERFLLLVPHYDILMGLKSIASLFLDNIGDDKRERTIFAPIAASFKNAHSVLERLHAQFIEFVELVADVSTDRYPFSASTQRMKTAPRPNERPLVSPFHPLSSPDFDPFRATGPEIRNLLPRQRPPDFDVDSLFEWKLSERPLTVFHKEEVPRSPKKYVGPHSESAAPDEFGIWIAAHNEPAPGQGWTPQAKVSPLKALEDLVAEHANRAEYATFRPGSIEASRIEEKAELWQMASAAFDEIAKEADLKEARIEIVELEDEASVKEIRRGKGRATTIRNKIADLEKQTRERIAAIEVDVPTRTRIAAVELERISNAFVQ